MLNLVGMKLNFENSEIHKLLNRATNAVGFDCKCRYCWDHCGWDACQEMSS